MHLTKAAGKELERLGLLPKQEKKPKPYAPYRSKWEKDYHLYLELCNGLTGCEVEIRFEFVSFCLVPASETQRGVWYLPDFTVWRGDRIVEIHEVKGFMRPGAKHKIKALAHILKPIPVYVVRKEGGEFVKERF
jgi:hypothetical protein